ncbi:unnamed protein product [Medioppia subpectinata]|uniref:Uncharacterized protein n=1 Tax=Medioppia subpectinata TaxID=1979941 RepID=A0A7R9L000_9ACAR|nr:unnamed protein product [Medioppia subpectinata]CAG2111841.1 unnamed protein product [Medioppia subpectinata]
MGCGAAKAVQTIEDNTNNANENKAKLNEQKTATNGVINNKASNGTNGTAAGPRRMSRPMTPVPKPVAFEIPLDDDDDGGGGESPKPATVSAAEPLKLPPKRLLTLAEQPIQHLSAKQLTEKQMKAEEKRLELLSERKLRCHKYNEKFLLQTNSENQNNDLNIINDRDVPTNEKKKKDI